MPHSPYTEIQSLGITLPPATAPVGAFTPAVRAGALVFLSGRFSDQSHMTKAVAQLTGVTPAALRNPFNQRSLVCASGLTP
jgi:enamine deaminase RidA (YjgF/YER057c/UK114 family)